MGACANKQTKSLKRTHLLSTNYSVLPSRKFSITEDNSKGAYNQVLQAETYKDCYETNEMGSLYDISNFEQRCQVQREILKDHQNQVSQRFFVVFDKLYKIQRKVPLLSTTNESTISKRRQQ